MTASGKRKEQKFRNEVCYFCGLPGANSNEDIPGKQFGVTPGSGGLIVPAHAKCNHTWSRDQEFFRLRIVLNAGTQPGARHGQQRELRRFSDPEQRKAQVSRYLKERAKIFNDSEGKRLMGLTQTDLERFSNVVRHWGAGVHYYKQKVKADLPGSVYPHVAPDTIRRDMFAPDSHGEWKLADGIHFGAWWFLPGPQMSQSIVVFNLLQFDELWFVVRFPAFKNKPAMQFLKKNRTPGAP